MQKHGRLKNVILLLVSFFLTFAALEIFLRLYGYEGYHPLERLRNGRELVLKPSTHPILKYEYTPGATGLAWGANVTINSHGFRGIEPSRDDYAGYRVLILGDSVTFGNYLELEATFAYKSQRLLSSDTQDFEILNFGVGGYDTLQEVALMEQRGLKYHPDLVVLAYCLNDAGIVSVNLEFIEKLQGFAKNPLFRLRLIQFIAERSDIIRRKFRSRYENIFFCRENEQWIDKISDDEDELLSLMESAPDSWPSSWYKDHCRIGRLRYAFRWLNELSRENGFAVSVMTIPLLTGNSGEYPLNAAHRIIELEARRAGFDTIDLVEQFMQSGVEALKIYPQDLIHPNEAGHSIIAAELAKHVRASAKKRYVHSQ